MPLKLAKLLLKRIPFKTPESSIQNEEVLDIAKLFPYLNEAKVSTPLFPDTSYARNVKKTGLFVEVFWIVVELVLTVAFVLVV